MRYLPLTEDDRAQMREAIGVPTAEALYADVPKDVLLTRPLDLPRSRETMSPPRALSSAPEPTGIIFPRASII